MNNNYGKFADAVPALKQAFGDHLSLNESVRAAHGHTVSSLDVIIPDAVLFAQNRDQVIEAVKICGHYKIPIIAYGAGSSLEGQLNAPKGGLTIDFSKMDQVIAFSASDMTITVEPGITRESLNSWLRDTGLFFPIDPGANASIGGMTATRASGTNAVRYGTMKDVVVNIEAVMADGRLIKTAQRAKKSAAGYDLTRLLVGSEGTLGIYTAITLKLFPIPETIVSGVCSFTTVEDACNAVIQAMQSALPLARIELLDAVQIAACNAYSNLQLSERPSLFVEFHGDQSSVEAQIAQFSDILADYEVDDFQYSSLADKRSKLWKARHDAFWATCALYPGADVFSTDVCVPISRLADCVTQTQKDLIDNHLTGPIVGHVGDGNFHVLLAFKRDDREEAARAAAFSKRLAMRAIEMDGTCTGEHGIGERKAPYLRMELGESVDFMQMIKKTLDPDNILNPGKYGFE